MSTPLAKDVRNGVWRTAEVEKILPDSVLRSVAAFEHGTMLIERLSVDSRYGPRFG